MAVDLVRNAGTWTLHLSGVVDVGEAGLLLEAAREAARETGHTVVADCAALESLDAASTQVLLALQRSLAASGGAFRMERVPAPVAELWRHAGLHEQLG